MWGWALLILIVAALTDAFDGWAARKYGTPTPKLGKDWIDPLGDAYLFTATVLGLVYHLPNTSQILLWVGGPLVLTWCWLKIVKIGWTHPRLQKFATIALPAAEWGGFWVLGLILIFLEFRLIGVAIYLLLSWPIIRSIVGYKNHRIKSWLMGQS
jgi:phosphatidylglycerophosphate synthase